MFGKTKALNRIATAIETANEIAVKALRLKYFQLGGGRYKAVHESIYRQVLQAQGLDSPAEESFDVLAKSVDNLLPEDERDYALDLGVDIDYLAAAAYDTTQMLEEARDEMNQRAKTREAGVPTPATGQ